MGETCRENHLPKFFFSPMLHLGSVDCHDNDVSLQEGCVLRLLSHSFGSTDSQVSSFHPPGVQWSSSSWSACILHHSKLSTPIVKYSICAKKIRDKRTYLWYWHYWDRESVDAHSVAYITCSVFFRISKYTSHQFLWTISQNSVQKASIIMSISTSFFLV